MCFAIAKYLLFAFNFVFWLAGAAILGVGIYLIVEEDVSGVVEVADLGIYLTGSYLMIAAGGLMLVVGFCGCCGAIKESTCLLGIYFCFLLVILGLQVGVGIAAFVEYGSLQETIDKGLNATFKAYADSSITAYGSMESTQQTLKCCGGVNGCTDWSFTGNTEGSVGCACNKSETENCEKAGTGNATSCTKDMTQSTSEYIYTQPCSNAINTFIEDNYQLLAILCICIGCAEVIGMIVSVCLCMSIKNSSKGANV